MGHVPSLDRRADTSPSPSSLMHGTGHAAFGTGPSEKLAEAMTVGWLWREKSSGWPLLPK